MEYDIEEYAQALPETAVATTPEPLGDPGHLLPQEHWDAVVAGVQ